MYERLLDKSLQPDEEALALYCGENDDRFRALNAYLGERYHTAREIRFPYGKQYGWCVTHRLGKKLVCDIFAEAGAFCVMLRLSDAQYASVYAALSEDVRRTVDKRYPCGDGGWIHARVTDEAPYRDIVRLLDVKCG